MLEEDCHCPQRSHPEEENQQRNETGTGNKSASGHSLFWRDGPEFKDGHLLRCSPLLVTRLCGHERPRGHSDLSHSRGSLSSSADMSLMPAFPVPVDLCSRPLLSGGEFSWLDGQGYPWPQNEELERTLTTCGQHLASAHGGAWMPRCHKETSLSLHSSI